jgi:putative oxidoreductase
MKKYFSVHAYAIEVDYVFLLIRIISGAALLQYGWFKIQNPFGWMGPDAPIPGVFQALAALSEFGGGIALIIGLITRLGALGILCTMAVAVLVERFMMHAPFVDLGGGNAYVLPLVLFT